LQAQFERDNYENDRDYNRRVYEKNRDYSQRSPPYHRKADKVPRYTLHPYRFYPRLLYEIHPELKPTTFKKMGMPDDELIRRTATGGGATPPHSQSFWWVNQGMTKKPTALDSFFSTIAASTPLT